MEIGIATIVIVMVQIGVGSIITKKLDEVLAELQKQGEKSPAKKVVTISPTSLEKASDHMRSVREF